MRNLIDRVGRTLYWRLHRRYGYVPSAASTLTFNHVDGAFRVVPETTTTAGVKLTLPR